MYSVYKSVMLCSDLKVSNEDVKRLSRYDDLKIGVIAITVFLILPHWSLNILISVLNGPLLQLE